MASLKVSLLGRSTSLVLFARRQASSCARSLTLDTQLSLTLGVLHGIDARVLVGVFARFAERDSPFNFRIPTPGEIGHFLIIKCYSLSDLGLHRRERR